MTSESFEKTDILCLMPAAGRGHRLGALTINKAKPAQAVSFDSSSGNIKRMIDLPLSAVKEVGGKAVVATFYRAASLDFISTYDHVKIVDDEGYMGSAESALRNIALIERSKASTICIVPADANLSAESLDEVCEKLKSSGAAAVILGSNTFEGNNVRPVDRFGLVTPTRMHRNIADLGIHALDKGWLIERLSTFSKDKQDHHGPDIWDDIYNINAPTVDIVLHVPRRDPGWIDMGTPQHFRSIVYKLNNGMIDQRNNIVFPKANIKRQTCNTIALPGSIGALTLQNAIIPEDTIAHNYDEVLEI